MGLIQEKFARAILATIRAHRTASLVPQRNLQPNASGPLSLARLREARLSDFTAVAKLKQRWGLAADSFENWERLWRDNPALKHTKLQCPIGWVLEADGAIVGYLGNISLSYRYGDRTLTAVTAHGFVVDPPYRAVGLSLASAFFRQKSVDLFVSTSAIEAVGKIALAFKSSPLPQPEYHTVLFWVLRPAPFARALMAKLKLRPALAKIGGVLAALAIKTDKILGRRWPRRSAQTFAIREIGVHQIGDDFRTLWTDKLEEQPRLLADRSPAALRWHFDIPGDRGCARVLCCYNDRELVGYTVIRSDTNQENGLRTSMIADMVAKRDDPEIVRALWVAAYDYAGHAGSHVLELLGFPASIRQVASGWNPYSRKYPACPFYYKTADPQLQKALSDGMAWYASPFDGDATLIRPSYSGSATKNTPEACPEDIEDCMNDAIDEERSEVC
jgi:hypothetical protein